MKLGMIMMHIIQEVENKRVAIIGNSLSLFNRKYGKEIDNNDFIVRLNRASMLYDNFNSIDTHGSRTDMWCMWRYKEYENVDIKEPKYKFQMAFWIPDSNIQTIQNDEIVKKFNPKLPSTGLMTLEWFSKLNTKEINVYGFDWKETPSWAYEIVPCDEEQHNFKKEKEYCINKYLSSGLFNFRM
jgi:hypothetical protein